MIFGPYPAVVASWHDGDTAHVDLDLGFGLTLAMSCRIYGINAPELATPEGKASLVMAQRLCPAGTKVTIVSHGWDKYGGRFDGAVTLPGGTDFSAEMIAAGAAVFYAG